jgi:hypothetical protein
MAWCSVKAQGQLLLYLTVGKGKSPDIDQIPSELFYEGGNILRSENHKRIINSIWKKEELPPQ